MNDVTTSHTYPGGTWADLRGIAVECGLIKAGAMPGDKHAPSFSRVRSRILLEG